MYKEYHRQYNHNNRITVSEWNVASNTAERDVIFLMPFRGPNILKRAIGELQTTSIVASCACLCFPVVLCSCNDRIVFACRH